LGQPENQSNPVPRDYDLKLDADALALRSVVPPSCANLSSLVDLIVEMTKCYQGRIYKLTIDSGGFSGHHRFVD